MNRGKTFQLNSEQTLTNLRRESNSGYVITPNGLHEVHIGHLEVNMGRKASCKVILDGRTEVVPEISTRAFRTRIVSRKNNICNSLNTFVWLLIIFFFYKVVNIGVFSIQTSGDDQPEFKLGDYLNSSQTFSNRGYSSLAVGKFLSRDAKSILMPGSASNYQNDLDRPSERRLKLHLPDKATTDVVLEEIEVPVDKRTSTFVEHVVDQNFKVLAEKAANPSIRQITLAIATDENHTAIACNYILCLKHANMKKILNHIIIIVLKKEICDTLLKVHPFLYCYYVPGSTLIKLNNGLSVNLSSLNYRTYYTLALLEWGYTVLGTDMNVVYFKDPIPAIQAITPSGISMVALRDEFDIANPYFVYCVPDAARIYSAMLKLSAIDKTLDDRNQLNIVLKLLRDSKKQGIPLMMYLPQENFCSGLYYFLKKGNLLPPIQVDPQIIAIQNNYIESSAAKILRMKEHSWWRLSECGYYNSRMDAFVTYDVDNIPAHQQIKSLAIALNIASEFGLTLILPPYVHSCIGGVPVYQGNNDSLRCPLQSVIRVDRLDKYFDYRESSYLANRAALERERDPRSTGIPVPCVTKLKNSPKVSWKILLQHNRRKPPAITRITCFVLDNFLFNTPYSVTRLAQVKSDNAIIKSNYMQTMCHGNYECV